MGKGSVRRRRIRRRGEKSAAGTRRLAESRATVESGEAERPRSALSGSEVAANRRIDRSRLIAPGPNRHRSRVKLRGWVEWLAVVLRAA